MIREQILTVVIVILISQWLIGQEPPYAVNSDTIAFQLTSSNNISVEAILNDQDTVDLMFHTAASGMTLTKEAALGLVSVNWGKSDTVKSWGGESEARYAEDNTIKIGSNQWDHVTIWENEHSGPGTDGKIGMDFFIEKVVEIDFDQGLFIISDTLPEKVRDYIPLALKHVNDFLFVEGSSRVDEQEYINDFLIHTGYGGTILYDDKFVSESMIGERITIVAEKELKDSYGNVLKTMTGVLPIFSLGGGVLEDIPVGFFEGSIGKQHVSVVGGDLLKRFNLIFDESREILYINSNTLRHFPYDG